MLSTIHFDSDHVVFLPGVGVFIELLGLMRLNHLLSLRHIYREDVCSN
jgi:hypothetical protein